MALIVKVDGQESFEVAKECVKRGKFQTEIPLQREDEGRRMCAGDRRQDSGCDRRGSV